MADQLTRNELLHLCLERIQSGEMTVEECIARYPEVTGLAGMLRLALSLRDADASTIALSDVRKQALERRLLQVWDQRVPPRPSAGWLRLFSAVAAMLLVAVGLLLGLAQISRPALPGDALYGYKRLVERAEVSFASAAAKPELLRRVAEQRLDEPSLIVARDKHADADFLRDVVTSVNDAIEAQPDNNQRQILYTHAQVVFAAIAVQGVNDAPIAAAAISTPIPQPTAVISTASATPTPVTATSTTAATVTVATASATSTASVTSSVTPSSEPSVLPSATVTSTATPRRLVTATSLASFTPTNTQTATVATSTSTQTDSPTPTSLLPTPFLPTLAADQLTPTVTLTPSETFAFTLTPIIGIVPTTQQPSPTEAEPTAMPASPTPTATETPNLPACPTETPTPTATLDTDITLTPTMTLTPYPEDFTPTPTETPLPCMPIVTDADSDNGEPND